MKKGEYKYPHRLELRLSETQMARLQSRASQSDWQALKEKRKEEQK